MQDPPNLLENVESVPVPGTPLPLNSKFYIERPPIETRIYQELLKPGSLIRIKAPRKMGKSSLILRLLNYASSQGYTTVSIDFQQTDTEMFASLDRFLRWFCANVARQLNLEPKLDDYWDVDFGSKVSASIYFKEYLLEKIKSPIVLVLNEMNYIFEYPNLSKDFLPLLRNWHEQAAQTQVWQKLRLVLIHSTEVYVLLSVNQSPFNVGLSIWLSEFTLEQVKELALRYRLQSLEIDAIAKLMKMVGGHPYLVHLALYHLWQEQISLERLLLEAPTQAGIYSNHLRGLLTALQNQPDLFTAFEEIINSEASVYLHPFVSYKLESLGLIKLQENGCIPACELYRLYFTRPNVKIDNSANFYLEELEQENQRLKRLVSIDELTQIANRRSFDNCFQVEWKRMISEKAPLSLILCDIDKFKVYNDTYGHKAGDECLRKIAQAMCKIVKRPADLVARYGGEEFAIILPEMDARGALQVAEDIRKEIKNLNISCKEEGAKDSERVVTISLGVASTVPGLDNDLGTLFLAADQALYDSKKLGRDRVTVSSLLKFEF